MNFQIRFSRKQSTKQIYSTRSTRFSREESFRVTIQRTFGTTWTSRNIVTQFKEHSVQAACYETIAIWIYSSSLS